MLLVHKYKISILLICCCVFLLDLEEGGANVNPSISACKRSETNEQSNSHVESEVDNAHMLSHAFIYPVLHFCHPLYRN